MAQLWRYGLQPSPRTSLHAENRSGIIDWKGSWACLLQAGAFWRNRLEQHFSAGSGVCLHQKPWGTCAKMHIAGSPAPKTH